MSRTRKQATQHRYGAVALFSCLPNGRFGIVMWSEDEQLNWGSSPP